MQNRRQPRVGIYLDFRNPVSWRRDPTEHHLRLRELASEADARGIGSIWVTEHHFVGDDHLSQPLVGLAALAAVTRQCRLGTAVLLAPLRDAVHIAEQAALVDVISGGRLELGLGAGYVASEFAAFDASYDERYGSTDTTIAKVAQLLSGGEVLDEHPGLRLEPAPVQEDLPLWAGYLGPVGARRAGRLGVGLLSLDPDRFADYRKALAEAGHDPASARTGGLLPFVVADDPDETAERLLPYRTHQLNSYRSQAAIGSGRTPRVLTEDEVRSRGSGVIDPLDVVTADEAISRIKGIVDDRPVEHVYMWGSVAGMPDDIAARQVELICDRVIPGLE